MSGLGIAASVVVAWLFDDEDEPRANRDLEGRRFRVGEDQAVMRSTYVASSGVYESGAALCQASDEAFYNTSPCRLRDLTSRARQHWCTRDKVPRTAGKQSVAQLRCSDLGRWWT